MSSFFASEYFEHIQKDETHLYGPLNEKGVQLGYFLNNNPNLYKNLYNWFKNPNQAHQYLASISGFESKGPLLSDVVYSLVILATIYREYQTQILRDMGEDFDDYPSFFYTYQIPSPFYAVDKYMNLFEGAKDFLIINNPTFYLGYTGDMVLEYLSKFANIPQINDYCVPLI